jgi:membrane protease YdiL (CAAX protease family)
MSVLLSLVRRYPLICYFVLVYSASALALTVIGVPRLDTSGSRPITSLIMFPVMVIAAGLSGLLMTALTEGKQGLRQLGSRMTRWQLHRWWLVLCIPPVGILSVLALLSVAVASTFEPQFLVFGIAAGLFAGFFEEIGWTGFAYPRMRGRFGALSGALVLGLLWAVWHVPVVDSLGAASPHGAAWPAFFASFAVVVIAMRVLIAWMYANTGSVFGAQLLHASSTGSLVVFGASSVSPGQEAFWYLAYGLVLWLVVALVVRGYGSSLRRNQRAPIQQASTTTDPLDVGVTSR